MARGGKWGGRGQTPKGEVCQLSLNVSSRRFNVKLKRFSCGVWKESAAAKAAIWAGEHII